MVLRRPPPTRPATTDRPGPGDRYRRRRPVAAALALGLAFSAACGDRGGSSGATADDGGADLHGTVTVFAAASLADAFGDVAEAVEDLHPRVDVELNLAGSPTLARQVLDGAPADVLATADVATMDRLVAAGAADRPRAFARNSLEIVVPAGNPAGVDGLADLADPDLLVGLCAAEVPCGDIARRVLARAGVTPAPDTQEPDVRSLLTKVAAGELDVGLVYRTDVRSAGDDVEGIRIPHEVDMATRYPVAVLDDAPRPELAAAFVDLVLGPRGRAIMASWGFLPA